jgi:hypothetical protein
VGRGGFHGFFLHFFWQNKGYYYWISGEPAKGLLKKEFPSVRGKALRKFHFSKADLRCKPAWAEQSTVSTAKTG